mgnify:CR=1 FL=1|tara:strand:- start:978 stop:1742 length:765 start_codon:yes stop_codon:yes gene_type:complete
MFKKLFITLKSFVNIILNRKIKYIGNYDNWNKALKISNGYSSHKVIQKKKSSILKILNGEASYEIDSFLYYKSNPDQILIEILNKFKKKITVCDFGGSFGSHYIRNRKYLESKNIQWKVVEQKPIVKVAKKLKIGKNLNFYTQIQQVIKYKVDIILFSSVLQYIEFPYKILDKVIKKKINYILILRTPFHQMPDQIRIQKIPKYIYEATYPVRILNYSFFLQYMKKNNYKIVKKINTQEMIDNIKYKGFLFKKM